MGEIIDDLVTLPLLDTEVILVKDKEVTTIKISKINHSKPVKHGRWGESLDDILGRVLDKLDECQKAKSKK